MIALALILAAAAPAPAPAPAPAAAVVTASGLRFETLKPGSGRRPAPGDAVLVTYEGRLADGTLFDEAEQPVGLPVSGTIPGFEEALLLMNEGGTYRIELPPHLAYGAEGAGGGAIPPYATLRFTLTLHRVGRAAAPSAAAD